MITHVDVQNDIFSRFCSVAYILRKGIGNGAAAVRDIAVCSHYVDFMLVVPSSDNRLLGSRNMFPRHPAINDQDNKHSNGIKTSMSTPKTLGLPAPVSSVSFLPTSSRQFCLELAPQTTYDSPTI